jgi:SAM-dependent methyltransferase
LPSQPDIAAHYSRSGLLQRLRAALAGDGIDPDRPSLEALAPYDHFHGRGLEATEEMADALSVASSDHILDIGSGIGGPARYVAHRFGCRVSGIDLTAEFCAVAQELTRLTGLADRVRVHEGTALAMPFASLSFEGAYSMNVAMNIADKDGLYREIRRVLKPDAWLVLSEAARGPGPAPDYPTPWANTAAASFLATPDETRRRLEADGFTVVSIRETTEQALAYGARSRALVERGEKPPHRAVGLIHGERAQTMAANVGRGVANSALVPIEVVCRKRG